MNFRYELHSICSRSLQLRRNTLPNALNGVATFYDPLNLVQAMTPSELGASMREAKANGDSRVKSNPAPTQNHGPYN